MGSFLEDDGVRDGLGVINGFRELMELYIKQLVEEGKWFTVCHKIDERQIDLVAIQGDGGQKLGSVIGQFYSESSYRTAIYKYLLRNFLCYVEVPTISYKGDRGATPTFDKMLVTANENVIASWLGIPLLELPDKYSSRVYSAQFNEECDLFPVVKLTESAKDGVRKVTCPRNDIDVSKKGTRVIPLFMLKTGVDTLHSRLSDITLITFLKDGGHVRDIFTTTDFNKIKEIYGPGVFYNEAVDCTYDGDFMGSKTISRGYIRVPEIGGSCYDNPTRSINYARIINIDYTAQPDLSFINIDLGSVLEGFQSGIIKYPSQADDIIEMLISFDIASKDQFTSGGVNGIMSWVETQSSLLSTVFLRDLCLFMLGNPQWFAEFDGSPRKSYVGSDVGLA